MTDETFVSNDRKSFETRLNQPPDDLSDLYSTILDEHAMRSKVPRNIQIGFLQWVTTSIRPMRLVELATILLFGLVQRSSQVHC